MQTAKKEKEKKEQFKCVLPRRVTIVYVPCKKKLSAYVLYIYIRFTLKCGKKETENVDEI